MLRSDDADVYDHGAVDEWLVPANVAWLTQYEDRVILNIASVNAYAGWPDLVVYASAKAALVTASKNLANALKYARVRVYCLNPGWIDTEGERAMMTRVGHPPDFLDREGGQFPLGRLMKPQEIAEVVAFLASDKAAAFSGTVIELEQFPLGGMYNPRDTEPTP